MKNATQEAKVADPEFDFSDFFRVTFKRDVNDQSSVASNWQAVGNR